MSNQKEIRARISSTISTQQITKAMKLVSATKLRKASEAIMRMRPYAMKLQGIMSNLQESVDDDKLAVYFKQREVKKVALVVISSDRGLCGAFNANVYKQVRRLTRIIYSLHRVLSHCKLFTVWPQFDICSEFAYFCH